MLILRKNQNTMNYDGDTQSDIFYDDDYLKVVVTGENVSDDGLRNRLQTTCGLHRVETPDTRLHRARSSFVLRQNSVFKDFEEVGSVLCCCPPSLYIALAIT